MKKLIDLILIQEQYKKDPQFKKLADKDWEYEFDHNAHTELLENVNNDIYIWAPYNTTEDRLGFYSEVDPPDDKWMIQLSVNYEDEFFFFNNYNSALKKVKQLKSQYNKTKYQYKGA